MNRDIGQATERDGVRDRERVSRGQERDEKAVTKYTWYEPRTERDGVIHEHTHWVRHGQRDGVSHEHRHWVSHGQRDGVSHGRRHWASHGQSDE